MVDMWFYCPLSTNCDLSMQPFCSANGTVMVVSSRPLFTGTTGTVLWRDRIGFWLFVRLPHWGSVQPLVPWGLTLCTYILWLHFCYIYWPLQQNVWCISVIQLIQIKKSHFHKREIDLTLILPLLVNKFDLSQTIKLQWGTFYLFKNLI